jgi:hypothetical protein
MVIKTSNSCMKTCSFYSILQNQFRLLTQLEQQLQVN